MKLPPSTLVYRINGPFFFGAAEKLQATLRRTQLHIETVVIRLGLVPFFDATGMQALAEIIERYQKQKIRVILCGIGPQLRADLEPTGILTQVGAKNVCKDLKEVAAALQTG